MQQISNEILKKAIKVVTETEGYKNFERRLIKRLNDFLKSKTFKYKDGEDTKEHTFINGDIFHQYTTYLKNNIRDIIKCDLIGFTKYKYHFNRLNFAAIDDNIKKGFYKKIQDLLQYHKLRSGNEKILFNFYKELGVKACVYCNSQHVILLKNSKIARLQADHNLPKSEYPHFSITFANLYPTCNNCNHIKKEKDINYQLYYDVAPSSSLKFKINDDAISEYLRAPFKRHNTIKISFTEIDSNINGILNINGIYENHTDVIEEILWKYKAYPESYMIKLKEQFGVDIPKDISNMMRYGNSLNKDEINKKVFSKLTIDVVEQLEKLK